MCIRDRSDSDRAHPGHGHFDFKKCIEVLYDIGYDGVLGHEYNADPDLSLIHI